MLEPLEKKFRRRLSELDAVGTRRRLAPPSGIDLCSNDYLGLANHPLLKKRMIEAIEEEGCGATASRLLRGERELFAKVEKRFAKLKKTASSLYFSSGYAANVGVLSSFLEKDDIVFSDQLNHASLIDGLRLSKARLVVFPHSDLKALKTALKKEQNNGQRFLVTESLFSMDGDFAPLQEYAFLCKETDTALIVDEAHAVGIYGAEGSGLIEELMLAEDIFLSVNSAGKAFGVSGAFVCGADWAIDYLIQKARTFIFSTAPVPGAIAAVDAALDITEKEPERREQLLVKAAYFRKLLSEHAIAIAPGSSQIVPIIIGDNAKTFWIAEQLQTEGFDVRAIRPPTVAEGTARLRISINISLTDQILEKFVSSLVRVIK